VLEFCGAGGLEKPAAIQYLRKLYFVGKADEGIESEGGGRGAIVPATFPLDR